MIGKLVVTGRADADIYKARSLTIGGRRFEDIPMVAHDFSFMKRETDDAAFLPEGS